jgi:hypothetical protein
MLQILPPHLLKLLHQILAHFHLHQHVPTAWTKRIMALVPKIPLPLQSL